MNELSEARKNRRTLADLKASSALHASYLANLRMQLWMIGETHRLLLAFLKDAKGALADAAKSDGKLDGLGLHKARTEIDGAWGHTFARWKKTFNNLREQVVAFPFGAMAVMHREMALANLEERALWNRERFPHWGAGDSSGTGALGALGESLRESENVLDYVFNPQLQAILDAASRRIYGDGLQLSQRLWNLDQESLRGIQQVLYNGLANGLSAWDIGKELERFLGAGADCPRWTRTRLNKLTKADIAGGDPTGLLSNSPNSIAESPCDGATGIAYNALRLARNEIQVAHAMATDAIVNRAPWIEKEKVNLSPAHAERDKCDDVANGGPNGDGVYDKNTIILPIHVSCMCYKTGVLIKADEFTSKLRGWMAGTERWSAMDRYADSIGGNLDVDLTQTRAAQMLLPWLWGTVEEMTRAAQ